MAEDDGGCFAELDGRRDERRVRAVRVTAVENGAVAARGVDRPVGGCSKLPAAVALDRPGGGVRFEVESHALGRRGDDYAAILGRIGGDDGVGDVGGAPDVRVAGLVGRDDAHEIGAVRQLCYGKGMVGLIFGGGMGDGIGEGCHDIHPEVAGGGFVGVVAEGGRALVRFVGGPGRYDEARVGVAEPDVAEGGGDVVDEGGVAAGRSVGQRHGQDVVVQQVRGVAGRLLAQRVLVKVVELGRENGVARIEGEVREVDFALVEEAAVLGFADIRQGGRLRRGNGQLNEGVGVLPVAPVATLGGEDDVNGFRLAVRRVIGDAGGGGRLVCLAVEEEGGAGSTEALNRIAEEVGLVVAPAHALVVDHRGAALVRPLVGAAEFHELLLEERVDEVAMEEGAWTANHIAGLVPAVAGVPDAAEGAGFGGGGEVLGDAVLVDCAGDAPFGVDEEGALVAESVGVGVGHLHVRVGVAVAEVVDDGDGVAVQDVRDVGGLPVLVRLVEGLLLVLVEEERRVAEAPETFAFVGLRSLANDFKQGLRIDAVAHVLAGEEGAARVVEAGQAVGIVLLHLLEPRHGFFGRFGRNAADGDLGVEVGFIGLLAVDAVAVGVEVAVQALVVEVGGKLVHLARRLGVEEADGNLARVAAQDDVFGAPCIVGVLDEGADPGLVVLPDVELANRFQGDDGRGHALPAAVEGEGDEGLLQRVGRDDDVLELVRRRAWNGRIDEEGVEFVGKGGAGAGRPKGRGGGAVVVDDGGVVHEPADVGGALERNEGGDAGGRCGGAGLRPARGAGGGTAGKPDRDRDVGKEADLPGGGYVDNRAERQLAEGHAVFPGGFPGRFGNGGIGLRRCVDGAVARRRRARRRAGEGNGPLGMAQHEPPRHKGRGRSHDLDGRHRPALGYGDAHGEARKFRLAHGAEVVETGDEDV